MERDLTDERRAELRIKKIKKLKKWLMFAIPIWRKAQDREYRDLLSLLDAPPAPTSEERKEMLEWLEMECVNCNVGPRGSKECREQEEIDNCNSIVAAIEALILSAPKVVSWKWIQNFVDDDLEKSGTAMHLVLSLLRDLGIAVEPEEEKK